MKICYFIKTLELGGAEKPIPRIIDVLRARGHEVQVIACYPGDGGCVPLLEAADIPYEFLFQSKHKKTACIRPFLRAMRREQPDLIWTSLNTAAFIGGIVGKWLEIPVVSWKNSTSAKLYSRLTMRWAALWIADSKSVTDYLRQGIGIAADRVVEWPIYESQPADVFPAPWHPGEVLHIGSAGRLDPVKGYDDFIAAIASLLRDRPALAGQLAVHIVGEGPERRTLEQAIHAAGLDAVIHLPGATNDVPGFLSSLHLYVQPSHYEGMCLAAHEAMAAGLPVIATPVGELRESISASGGGVLLDPVDVAGSLAREMAALIDHPDRLYLMGKKAQNYVQTRYSAQAFDIAGRHVVRRVEEIVRAASRRGGCVGPAAPGE